MFGKGILKGLAVTAKNLVGSYTDRERLVTIQYPEEKRQPFENTREFPFLIYDDNDPVNGLRCVACQICEKECPPQCIYIVKKSRKKPDGKIRYYPEIFDIDFSVCMSCQICVEVCPFDAIKMDSAFGAPTTNRFEGLLMHLEQLAKPNEYFHRINPTEAKRSDERVKG